VDQRYDESEEIGPFSARAEVPIQEGERSKEGMSDGTGVFGGTPAGAQARMVGVERPKEAAQARVSDNADPAGGGR
jgi:hypothetical protein